MSVLPPSRKPRTVAPRVDGRREDLGVEKHVAACRYREGGQSSHRAVAGVRMGRRWVPSSGTMVSAFPVDQLYGMVSGGILGEDLLISGAKVFTCCALARMDVRRSGQTLCR